MWKFAWISGETTLVPRLGWLPRSGRAARNREGSLRPCQKTIVPRIIHRSASVWPTPAAESGFQMCW
ncbi:MAG: hypothetical protein RLZZ440_314 [Planctomycetota bacterium]